MIYLFHGLDEIPPSQFQKLLNILPRERQQYILHYRRIEDQKRSAMGWLLLCHGLYQEYGIADLPPLDFTSSGKPFFLQKALPFFNISHSGSFATCALYHEEIGLDVQKLTTPRPSLVKRVCTEEEHSQISSPADFCRLWSRKESAVKLTGEGITENFCEILALHPDMHTSSVPLKENAGYLSYSIYKDEKIPVIPVTVRQLLERVPKITPSACTPCFAGQKSHKP